MAQLVIRDRHDIRANDDETRARLQTGHVVSVHPDDPALVLPPPLAVIAAHGMSVEDAERYVGVGLESVRAFRVVLDERVRTAIKTTRRFETTARKVRAIIVDERGNQDMPLASELPWWYRWLWVLLGWCRR